MPLIDATFYTNRYGPGDATQIAAFIDDVSAEVVDYLNTLDTDSVNPIDADDWGVDSGETDPPAAIQAAVARIVNRSIGNPLGITQEGLGDHQRSFSMGMSGGMMSPKDRRIIRRAAGASGGQNLEMEGYLPLEREPVEAELGL